MPKLAIVDPVVSAGGVERFLQGLVGGLLELPEIKQWEITIFLAKNNSGGYRVSWPEHLRSSNLSVRFLRDDQLSGWFDKLTNAQNVWGIRGTARAQRIIPSLVRRFGPPKLRIQAGDVDLSIERCLQEERFDLVYFNFPYLAMLPAFKIPNIPMVATVHDFNYERFPGYTPGVKAQISQRMLQWLVQCKRVIVSTHFIADEFRHFYPEFADKVHVVYPGIPGDPSGPTWQEAESYRQRMNLPKQFLLVVGWIAPHKNQRVVFEALGKLKDRRLSNPLVCVGPNSKQLQPKGRPPVFGYVLEVLKTAEQLGLQHGRDFWGLGYVDEFELECLYRLAKALIVPSVYEAGSFSILEAMRAGCPVIASDIASFVEQIDLVGNYASFFDASSAQHLSDVIIEVLADLARTQEMARQASQVVKSSYSWQRAAEQYLSIFQSVPCSTDVAPSEAACVSRPEV